jgi:hypothetical protein
MMVAPWAAPLRAQMSDEYQPADNAKINSNPGITVNVPVSSAADVINTGWGFSTGIGYNFNRRNAFVGEFLWNRV